MVCFAVNEAARSEIKSDKFITKSILKSRSLECTIVVFL